ncbi:MAG: hypothetical protein AAGA18_07680 [Verrucomicrobiota bacterium]
MRKTTQITTSHLTPPKYIFSELEGKARKAGAHRYERRKVKQNLRLSPTWADHMDD